MASAYPDRRSGGWVASFRPLHAPKAQRRLARLPAALLRAGHEDEDANLLATECDHCCRLLEMSVDPALVERALAIKAITTDQAIALRAGLPAPSHRADVPQAWTLKEAALRHPSSQREAERDPVQYMRHVRDLQEFLDWSKVRVLSDLTLEHVVRYVAHLRQRGYSWDGRRHRLLFIRRASAMAGNAGLPNPLGDMVLDRREDHEHAEIDGWEMPQLVAGAAKLKDHPDRRVLAILALGGFVGLRSSEICRVRVKHLGADGVLTVGREIRKTRASRRDLPLPRQVVAWLRPLTFGKDGAQLPPDAFVIRGRGNQHRDRPMTPNALSEMWTPVVAAATGRELTPKHLRKTWLTWAVRTGLPLTLVEAYAGHRATSVLAVTSASYLIAHQVVQFRPIAEAMEVALASVPLPANRSTMPA